MYLYDSFYSLRPEIRSTEYFINWVGRGHYNWWDIMEGRISILAQYQYEIKN